MRRRLTGGFEVSGTQSHTCLSCSDGVSLIGKWERRLAKLITQNRQCGVKFICAETDALLDENKFLFEAIMKCFATALCETLILRRLIAQGFLRMHRLNTAMEVVTYHEQGSFQGTQTLS